MTATDEASVIFDSLTRLKKNASLLMRLNEVYPVSFGMKGFTVIWYPIHLKTIDTRVRTNNALKPTSVNV